MSALTRLLYAEDEVIASLISSLIKKRDIRESYFWISELYTSGIDVFQIIWQIYFDFYADINNNVDNYIRRKEKKWKKTGDFKQIAHTIHNLFHLESTGTVFQLRHYILSGGGQNLIYRGRRPQWLSNFEKIYHNLLLSIQKKDLINIAFHLSKILKTSNAKDVFTTLMYYYEIELGQCDLENAIKYWDKHSYKDKTHLILGTIIHMLRKEYKLIDKFIQAKETHIEWIEELELEAGFVYDNLKKRSYSIDDKIGGFNLSRFALTNYIDEYEGKWEYYASLNPIWKKRCNDYNASFKDNTIIFPDDDKLEDFYEKYGYEPDEQPKNIRKRALIEIKRVNNMDLYEYLFGKEPSIHLPDNYIYKLN